MGKTKLTIMDDLLSQEEEKKSSSAKASADKGKEKPSKKVGKKAEKATEEAKLESAKASGEVEQSQSVIPSDSEESQDLKKQESGDSSASPQNDRKEKPQKMGKAKPRSKKYQEVSKDLDRSKYYPVNEAVELLKKLSYTKFNATIEAHINTVASGLRGFVSLPYASGKKIRILVFGKGAESSGADLVGSDETIEDINKGKIAFDLVITTPEWMPKLAKVARILGPRGLMPNPKSGTITDDLKKAVAVYQAGKTEYKTEAKAPIIHLALGKLDQPKEELSANIKTFLMNLGKTKIKKVTLSPTMGPSVKLDLTSI